MSTSRLTLIELPQPTNAVPFGKAESVARSRDVLLHLSMLAIYGVLLSTTSLESEVVSQLKTLSRIGGILILAYVQLACISRTSLHQVLIYFTFPTLYWLFANASVSWSPLPGYSLRQLASLTLMILFAATLARLTNSIRHVSIVMLHLVILLFLRVISMLGAIAVFGSGSIGRGSIGQIWHSTDAADTAGLGLIVVIAAAWICKFQWAQKTWVVAATCFLGFSLLAQNRLSLVLNPLMILAMMFVSANRKLFFWGLFSLSLLLPIVLVVDAKIDLFGSAASAAGAIANRDNSTQSAWSFSGRDELWAIIWDEYQAVKLQGHGFMVTSSAGEFEVWNEVHNWDAHNMILHVLATNGLIGLGMVGLILAVPCWLISHHILKKSEKGRFARTAGVLLAWLLLWSLLNVSFMGYINSSQLVFYALFGMTVGYLKRQTETELSDNAGPQGATSQ